MAQINLPQTRTRCCGCFPPTAGTRSNIAQETLNGVEGGVRRAAARRAVRETEERTDSRNGTSGGRSPPPGHHRARGAAPSQLVQDAAVRQHYAASALVTTMAEMVVAGLHRQGGQGHGDALRGDAVSRRSRRRARFSTPPSRSSERGTGEYLFVMADATLPGPRRPPGVLEGPDDSHRAPRPRAARRSIGFGLADTEWRPGRTSCRRSGPRPARDADAHLRRARRARAALHAV